MELSEFGKFSMVGTDNIGTGPVYNVMRLNCLTPVFSVDRNPESQGLAVDRELHVSDSSLEISFLAGIPNEFGYVFDTKSVKAHFNKNALLKDPGRIMIDLTSAKLGKYCVPSVNVEDIFPPALADWRDGTDVYLIANELSKIGLLS